MRIPGKLVLSSIFILAASGQALAETSLRHRLLESVSPTALYSVDDRVTVFKTADKEDVGAKLGKLCSEVSGSFTAAENSFACHGIFESSRVEAAYDDEQSFIFRTVEAQPLAYLSASIPSIEEITPLPNGKIAGEHASIDIYQYMYALCKKENGTPSVVISKRFGKIARYTEVGAEEAFSHLLSSGDGKDPWFFACEGEVRFMVEKDYQYKDGASSFYFHPKRGLEWVDYVKAEDGKLARLEAR